MSLNAQVADALDQIAALMELTGENRFKVIAHERAARVIRDLSEDVGSMSPEELQSVEGVGEKIARKIVQFREEGRIDELEELRAKVPAGLIEVLQVPGLGPKTVARLWKEAGITSMDELKRALDSGELESLPRMGAKTLQNIREAIAFTETSGERLPIGIALPEAEAIVAHLRSVAGVRKIAYAGSLRRGRDTIGDVDIVCVADPPDPVREAFTTMAGVRKVLASGETKCSVRLAMEGGQVVDGRGAGREVQVDLRIVPASSWGAALLYFTGSRAHNIRLRERALKKRMTLNEYGLYPLDDDPTPPQRRGVRPIASRTEEAIYTKLGLPTYPPEMREDRGELDLREIPPLVEVGDIRAELHAHTIASDGRMTLAELVDAAIERGFHTIAVTDHSKASAQANGLSVERLREHVREIREENARRGRTIEVLAGSEVDILADGRLDYEDEVLAELDIVVASPHSGLSQDPKKATKRLLRVIEHPLVHILGHPTGRLLPNRRGLEPDMHEIVHAAREHGVALEINSHWKRLDLRDTHVRMAVEAGCLIAIDCDVHRPEHFDNLRYGVMTARRGWLTRDHCVNTWTRQKLLGWLRKKRQGASG